MNQQHQQKKVDQIYHSVLHYHNQIFDHHHNIHQDQNYWLILNLQLNQLMNDLMSVDPVQQSRNDEMFEIQQ